MKVQSIETTIPLSTVFALAYETAKKNVRAHERYMRSLSPDFPEYGLACSQLEKARATLDEITRVYREFNAKRRYAE